MAERGNPTPKRPQDMSEETKLRKILEDARQNVKSVVKQQRAGEHIRRELSNLRLKSGQ